MMSLFIILLMMTSTVIGREVKGIVVPVERLELRSHVSGIITNFDYKIGDVIESEKVLLSLVDSLSIYETKILKSEIQNLDKQISFFQVLLKSEKRLKDKGTGSLQEYARALFNLENKVSERDFKRIKLEAAKVNIASRNLKFSSPFYVNTKTVVNQQYVDRNTPLGTLISVQNNIRFHIPFSISQRISKGFMLNSRKGLKARVISKSKELNELGEIEVFALILSEDHRDNIAGKEIIFDVKHETN